MGRKFFAIALGALALPIMSVPAMAQGKGLNCMRGEYSGAQREELAQLGPQVSVSGAELDQAVVDRIGAIAMTAIETCTVRHNWTEEQSIFATLFELGRVNETAYRASGQLSAEELRSLDDALATGNRDRLWSVIENGVMAGMGDTDAPVPNGDAMLLGVFLIGAGLDVENEDLAVAEKAGLLLGFMALQRLGRREFANLQ